MPSSRHHNEWLWLIEVSGPFLSVPVLEWVLTQGLGAHDPEHARLLKMAFEDWEDNQQGDRPNPAIHREWVNFVLKQTLGLSDEVIAEGQDIPQALRATIAEHGETLRRMSWCGSLGIINAVLHGGPGGPNFRAFPSRPTPLSVKIGTELVLPRSPSNPRPDAPRSRPRIPGEGPVARFSGLCG